MQEIGETRNDVVEGSRLFVFDQDAFVADQRVRDAQLRIARDRARARGDFREEMEIDNALRRTQRQVEGYRERAAPVRCCDKQSCRAWWW